MNRSTLVTLTQRNQELLELHTRPRPILKAKRQPLPKYRIPDHHLHWKPQLCLQEQQNRVHPTEQHPMAVFLHRRSPTPTTTSTTDWSSLVGLVSVQQILWRTSRILSIGRPRLSTTAAHSKKQHNNLKQHSSLLPNGITDTRSIAWSLQSNNNVNIIIEAVRLIFKKTLGIYICLNGWCYGWIGVRKK